MSGARVDIVPGTGSRATHGNYYWRADLVSQDCTRTVARLQAIPWFN